MRAGTQPNRYREPLLRGDLTLFHSNQGKLQIAASPWRIPCNNEIILAGTSPEIRRKETFILTSQPIQFVVRTGRGLFLNA